MKILNYTLFVASASVKNFLFNKGVDPDTVYLNDYKFMKKVFKILVSFIYFLFQKNLIYTNLRVN
jgi:hypothetical protein